MPRCGTRLGVVAGPLSGQPCCLVGSMPHLPLPACRHLPSHALPTSPSLPLNPPPTACWLPSPCPLLLDTPAGRPGAAGRPAARPAGLPPGHRPARPPAGGLGGAHPAEQGVVHARPRAGAAPRLGRGGRLRRAWQQDNAPGGAHGQPRQHRRVRGARRASACRISSFPASCRPALPAFPAARTQRLATWPCACPPAAPHTPQKDGKRLERLRANAAATGGSIISPRHADFLSIDPEAPEYRGVAAVLLDPSCSGSGTAFSRMDYLLPSSADRLKGSGTGAAGEGCWAAYRCCAPGSCSLRACRSPARPAARRA